MRHFDKICRENSERREKDRQKMLDEVIQVLGRLNIEIPFSEAYLYGSIAKPHIFDDSSDIDIALGGLDGSMVYYVTGRLSSTLGREVDVVRLEDISFREKIEREGILWRKE